MSIKKNIFAPLASGLGATRRAAMLLVMMLTMTAQTAWATDKTLSGSESYTAQDGDVLTGSTSGTVTIAADAKITLSDVTITGGIVCAGTAEITLVGTNSVTAGFGKAGIQVGDNGTTLTIKGNGSLTANGGDDSAGIGLSRAWKVDATGGDIVIEGGNITATGDGMGAGIGTGVCFGGDSDRTATLGNITIKGGTVRAIGGTDNGNGIGKGFAYVDGHAVVGTITIYDGIDLVDASSISESVTYMYGETNVTANKTDYFTITEDGNRRVIFPKDDTDYTITIADGIEHGTIACEATTAKLGANVTITATTDQGYIFSRLVVKDAQNNDVASTGNSFFMPRSNVTVSAIFAEGSYNGTCGNGVYYAYDSSTKTLTISGTGAMTDYNDLSERPWDGYASDIQTVVIGAGVTSIGMRAFQNCPNLATVTVYAPSCTLGDKAFVGCNNLAKIYVFSDLVDGYKSAWSDYTSIITGITGGYCGATDHETDVVWVLTGESTNYTLTIRGTGAMYDYDNSSEYPWYSYADQIQEVVIENGVTSIGAYAFFECTNLESVTFAEVSQLESIGEYAFSGTALTSIEIPASVTSIGNNAFYECHSLQVVTFAEDSQLESIGEYAFQQCSNLTSITIPASVTSIGEDVFLNCDNLASITVEDGNTFYDSRNGCNAIIEKSTNTLIIGCNNSTIPAGVTSIGAWAFYATGLTSIEIPASVTSIGAWAFGVTGLTSIEIPASVTSIGDYAFGCCPNLATVTVCAPSCTLGEDAFDGCEKLANIYVFSDLVDDYKGAENWSAYEDIITGMPNPNGKCGDNVRWVLTGESPDYTLTISGEGAMYYGNPSEYPWYSYAGKINEVVIGNGVTSISNNAFQGCSNLATVSFAPYSTLKTIGDGAFQGCSNLTSITIPASVTSIGSDVFANCSNLASITVDGGNTVYDSRNGCNAIIEKATNTLIIGCKNSTIPAGVTSIGESAFYATDLTSIEIPAGVTSIGAWAFCVTGLTSIEIPASVTSIGMRAFQNCPNLATVTVYAPSCTLGDKAFLNCSNLENIYVFSDLVDDYQAAWSAYAGKITALPTVTTSYVDATGTLHENVEAVPLNNAMTTLSAGWYVVNSDISYTGTITLDGDVNIILADGKTMTVTNTGTNTGDFAIYGEGRALHIYGQSQGTGALTATANSSVAIKVDDYITINGGTVTATSTGDVGIYGIDGVTINGGTVNANGIYADGDITINGGKVTNNSDPGIRSNNGTIILGLRNATDYITAESYNGAVKVADGKTLVDDGGNIWSGTLSNDDLQNSLLNKTLRPVMGVVLTKDGSGNISAEFDGTSLETVSIPINITVNSVTLNRTFTLHKCATLMLPFSLGVGQSLNGGTLYKFDGVNNGEGDWVATLSEFTSPLKANTPYLIEPNAHVTDDKITFDLNGGTVTLNTTTAGEDSNEKDDLWDFIGTYSYIKWTTDTDDQDYSAEREAEIGKVYGFAAVEKTGIHVGDFVRVASGAKIRPMCAYLKWKGSIPNNARSLTRGAANDDTELPQRITVKLVSASGETTAIGTLDTTTGEVSFDSEAWYTLDGVRLSGQPSTKGIYINNGKKIVIK